MMSKYLLFCWQDQHQNYNWFIFTQEEMNDMDFEEIVVPDTNKIDDDLGVIPWVLI